MSTPAKSLSSGLRPAHGASSDVVFFFTKPIFPYKMNLVRWLSLPRGLRISWGYREQWVAEPDGAKHYKGRRGILLFEIIDNDGKPTSIHPLRWVTVLDVEKIDDVFYFHLELGGFIQYQSGFTQNDIMAIFTTKYLTKGAQFPQYNVIPCNGFTLDDAQETSEESAWTGVVGRLLNENDFRNVIFLHVLEVTDESRGVSIHPKSGKDRNAYVLEHGHSYRVRVLQKQLSPINADTGTLSLEIHVPETFALVNESSPVTNRYEVHDFSFRARGVSGDRAVIEFQVNQSGFETTKLPVPIGIKRSQAKRYVAIALFATGIFLAAMSSRLPPEWTIVASFMSAILSTLGIAWIQNAESI